MATAPHHLSISVSQTCLSSVLEKIAAYGQVVFQLQEFIDEVMGHSSENMAPGNGPVAKKLTEAPFRTYQAFMWALYKYFITFKEELAEIEKCIIGNGGLAFSLFPASRKALSEGCFGHRVGKD